MTAQTGRGAVEYKALVDAMDTNRPACLNDWRFIQERQEIDPAEHAVMRRICRRCPISIACIEYARKGRPPPGMWAGRYWGRTERTKQ